jgi:hypothetical protein
MFVYFVNQSSVSNFIFSKILISLYIVSFSCDALLKALPMSHLNESILISVWIFVYELFTRAEVTALPSGQDASALYAFGSMVDPAMNTIVSIFCPSEPSQAQYLSIFLAFFQKSLM